MQGRRTWHVVLVVMLVVLWGLANRSLRSAEKPGAVADGTASPAAARAEVVLPPSPAEVVRALQQAHADRDYDAIGAMIVAEHRDALVRLVRAADAVVDADARLQENAESRFGGPMSEAWDLSSMQDNMGPLSKNLKLLNQRFRGKNAVVTLQEGNHVPLVRAVFKYEDDAWRYDPEGVPHKVVDELWQLAYLLNEIDAKVRDGISFEAYFDTFIASILPQMSRVATVQDDVGNTSVASSAGSDT